MVGWEKMNEQIPYGYCQCGCGQKTGIAKIDNRRWGHIKGEPFRFCHGHFNRTIKKSVLDRILSKFTQGNPDECWIWEGTIDKDGYGDISR